MKQICRAGSTSLSYVHHHRSKQTRKHTMKSNGSVVIKFRGFLKILNSWTGFHNNLIQLNFNPKYCPQNYSYLRTKYQECLKQNL